MLTIEIHTQASLSLSSLLDEDKASVTGIMKLIFLLLASASATNLTEAKTPYLALFKHVSFHGGTTLCNVAKQAVTTSAEIKFKFRSFVGLHFLFSDRLCRAFSKL